MRHLVAEPCGAGDSWAPMFSNRLLAHKENDPREEATGRSDGTAWKQIEPITEPSTLSASSIAPPAAMTRRGCPTEKHGIKMPSEVAGWLMLQRSGLSQDQKAPPFEEQSGGSYVLRQDRRKVGLSQQLQGKGKGYNKWRKPAQT